MGDVQLIAIRLHITNNMTEHMAKMDRAMNSRSKDLGFVLTAIQNTVVCLFSVSTHPAVMGIWLGQEKDRLIGYQLFTV